MTILMALTLQMSVSAAPPLKVNLGSTESFAVLAGSTITNTGATTITGDAGGDVGLDPGSAVTGQASMTISGTVHVNDAVAIAAKTDLVIAYDDAALRAPTAAITGNLGGQTLVPGVYNSASSIGLTGTLTLDAQGDPEAAFIFQAGSTLTAASASRVRLINGARYCRVFWQVGSSATIGTNSNFIGHILAMDSITLNTGARVQGQVLARNGAVTLDTNTITNGACAAAASLTVVKAVVNDNAGTAVPADFTIHVKTAGGSGTDVAGSPSVGDAVGTVYSLIAGDYTISEIADIRYVTSFVGADAAGNFTLTAGEVRTITVTNDDITGLIPPIINITKTPNPLAIDAGSGEVVYTFRVTNPGIAPLSSVTVVDDKIATVTYVSGDTNTDALLQTTETWIYTAKAVLTATTTNIVTASGNANGMTSVDTATATVVVTDDRTSPTGGGEENPIYPPLINITKVPNPLVLAAPQGVVTYTYRVTNPGRVQLKNVVVTDDKITNVAYVSGDTNTDGLLQTTETWVYVGKATLLGTTTNTATAKGDANGKTVTDTAVVTVVVGTPRVTSINPNTGAGMTSTGGYLVEALWLGSALLLFGAGMLNKSNQKKLTAKHATKRNQL